MDSENARRRFAGIHVAIIMDGNGRWAERRGLARAEGHRAGAEAVERVVRASPSLGVNVLTLYAFSGNNWARPGFEVHRLMELFADFFRAGRSGWRPAGVRLSVIGRRDRLPPPLTEAIEAAERSTRDGKQLHLRIAIDYSGQEVILEAARLLQHRPARCPEDFGRLMAAASHACADDPPVDLLIRSGGEQRLSDFLLWELAYAEIWFSEKLWPDFGPGDLAHALRWFDSRERRYGRLAPAHSEEAAVC